MSTGRQPFLPTLQMLTRASREKAAVTLFDLEGQGLTALWRAYFAESDGRRDEGFELEISWPLPETGSSPLLSPAETDALAADLAGASTTPQ
jgi:hypothetical protein